VNRSDRPEDDGILRPKMGRRRSRDRDGISPFHVRMARTAPRRAGDGTRRRRGRNNPGRIAVREPHALSRRCVIKARYVGMTASGRKLAKAHLAYLERDGVERDGSPGHLYGADEKFSAEEFREPLAKEKRQFRFIVSPEDGAQLDLTEFARQFMRQVEKDTGRRLIWAAVNHHDTDNPHVHIVVRGVDRDGDDLRIDGRYLGEGMRWRAQEIVTRELGRRSEMDVSMVKSPVSATERGTARSSLNCANLLGAWGTRTRYSPPLSALAKRSQLRPPSTEATSQPRSSRTNVSIRSRCIPGAARSSCTSA